MFDGDGGEMLELQAYQIAQNAMMGRPGTQCPGCNIVMNPVQAMYSLKGFCPSCHQLQMAKRIQGKMA